MDVADYDATSHISLLESLGAAPDAYNAVDTIRYGGRYLSLSFLRMNSPHVLTRF